MDDFTSALAHLFESIGSGKALLIISAAITVLMQAMKAPWFGGVIERMPGWAKRLLPIGLGLASSILSHLATGMPWHEALEVGITGGYIASSHYQAALGAKEVAIVAARKLR